MAKWHNSPLDKRCMGKIYHFIDAQKKSGVRFHSPEHLVEMLYKNIKGKLYEAGEKAWFDENKDKLVEWAADYQQRKPEIFGRNSPLESKLQLGPKSNHYELSFGCHRVDGRVGGYVSDSEFDALLQEMDPWSCKHVHSELDDVYSTSLPILLQNLWGSPIEEKLAKYWLQNYYAENNPALLSQIAGAKKKFWVNKDLFGGYKVKGDIDFGGEVAVVRFDFGLINYKKQKKLLIELDGHEFHKSKAQRSKDAVKRKIATQFGWDMLVFTGTQVTNEFDDMIAELKPYFLPD
jgi:very-short-patch-repair endonuclease